MALDAKIAAFITEIVQTEPKEELPTQILNKSDYYTHKFETEKRKGEGLDDKIRRIREKIARRQEELKNTIGWKKEEHKALNKVNSLETQLEHTKIRLSQLKSDNEHLREQIQLIRRNNMGAARETRNISFEIMKSRNLAESFNGNSVRNKSLILSSRKKAQRLNQRFKADQSEMSFTESKLEDELQERSKSISPMPLQRARTPFHEISDHLKILKCLSRKWTRKVTEKTELIKDYDQQLKEYSLALTAMGASICSRNVKEITKANLNSYEQEIMLRCNLLQLNEQNEVFEHELGNIHEKIQYVRNSAMNIDTGKSDFLAKKQAELSNLKNKIQQCDTKYRSIEDDFKYLSKAVLEMLKRLQKLGIQAFSQRFVEDPELTYTNIILHLSKLEEVLYIFGSSYTSFREQNRYRFTPEPGSYVSVTPQGYSRVHNNICELEIDLSDYEEHSQPLTVSEFRQKAMSQLNLY